MRYRWLFVLCLILCVFFAVPAQAQQTVSLNQLEVFLWPEYDRSEVLVIYTLELAANVPLPAQVRLRIPSAAGEPNAIATAANWQEAQQGGFLNVPYARKVQGEWAWIEITNLTTPVIRIEYYDALLKNGQQRDYTFAWMGDYATDALSIQVQHPLNSSQMQISPDFSSNFIGSDNLTYSTYNGGSLPAGQTFSVHFSYIKPDDALTANQFQPLPAAPVTEDTLGRSTWTSSGLPWLLGIAGLALIIGGGVWYWQTTRAAIETAPKTRHRKRTPSAAARQNAPKTERTAEIYCHQCGNRAGENDRFCRTCGTRLRVE